MDVNIDYASKLSLNSSGREDLNHNHVSIEDPILRHDISSSFEYSSLWPNFPLHLQGHHQTPSSSSTHHHYVPAPSNVHDHDQLIRDHHHQHRHSNYDHQVLLATAAGYTNNIFMELDDHKDDQDQATAATAEEDQLGAMKELMYKIASMQPVDIDPATIRKPKRQNVRISDDPQSVAARHRRERISEKIRILQRLVPGGTKLDTASMLDEAIRYLKFLKRQIRLLQSSSSSSSNNFNNINIDDHHHPHDQHHAAAPPAAAHDQCNINIINGPSTSVGVAAAAVGLQLEWLPQVPPPPPPRPLDILTTRPS